VARELPGKSPEISTYRAARASRLPRSVLPKVIATVQAHIDGEEETLGDFRLKLNVPCPDFSAVVLGTSIRSVCYSRLMMGVTPGASVTTLRQSYLMRSLTSLAEGSG